MSHQLPPTEPLALEMRQLQKSFGNTAVIQGVDLAIAAGERVALIGPNGAGKSTLFHLVSGRLAPDSGAVWLHGQRIDGKKPFEINRLGLSRSFQISSLFGQLSVFDNLRCALLWGRGYRYSFWHWLPRLRETNARTEALLAQLHLSHKRHVLAAHLTYAEQRALEVGLTIAGEANVILLDEPTAGMGRSETAHFVQLIAQVTQGRTLLMVEHDMGVVFDLADKIAVLVYGQIIAFDTPERVRSNPQVQAAYLGNHHLAGAPDAVR